MKFRNIILKWPFKLLKLVQFILRIIITIYCISTANPNFLSIGIGA